MTEALVEVLKQHAGIDFADETYYCLGCLEGLGIAHGVEQRWAEHVAEALSKPLRDRIHETARMAINSVYGTDDRHAYMGLRIAQRVVFGNPLPWKYEPRTTPVEVQP